MTCFEPETKRQLVEGLAFHKFYFDHGGGEYDKRSWKSGASKEIGKSLHFAFILGAKCSSLLAWLFHDPTYYLRKSVWVKVSAIVCVVCCVQCIVVRICALNS